MAVYTTIDNPELYFQVKLYSGTGSSNAITLDGDEDMQPDMIWIKNRADSVDHRIFDSVRGASISLIPNNTAAEYNDTSTVMLSSFNSDGFTVVSHSNVNDSSDSHVAYCWKESADAGFDIISYAGNGSAARELSHSLSATPHFIIVKNRDDSVDWFVYHQGMSDNNNNKLNTTDAQFGGAYIYDPTSSIFKLRDHNVVNDSGDDYIAYAFTEKQGFSKAGSFKGLSSTDGPFIYTGFTPSMILYKNADYAENWHIQSWKQESLNPNNNQITPNETYAESSDSNTNIDFLSNGFKMRSSHRTSNYTGNTFIYIAFADAPFVNSKGVPCNAR